MARARQVYISQVDPVLVAAGFEQTEAAGNKFYWYEYPAPFHGRDQVRMPVARVQFFDHTGDIECWLYDPRPDARPTLRDTLYQGRLTIESNVPATVRGFLQGRLDVAEELFGAPRELLAAAYDRQGMLVLTDWLYEHGVDPDPR